MSATRSAVQRPTSPWPSNGGLPEESIDGDPEPAAAGPLLAEFLDQVRVLKGIAGLGTRDRISFESGLERLWLLADDLDELLLVHSPGRFPVTAAPGEAQASWWSVCHWLRKLRAAVRGGPQLDPLEPPRPLAPEADI